MGEPGARAALSTFYQKCRSALPDYDCEHQKSVNQWSCTVSCVAVSINGRDVPDIFQTASAQNKKGAMNAAAKLALDELKTTEAYLSLQPPSNLWDVVQQALNDKGLRREPVLLGHQILANRRHDGWLSLSALCTVPSIQAWFRREAPDKQHDQHAMMDHMLHALDQHASAKDDEIRLLTDPPRIKRSKPASLEPPAGKVPAETVLDTSIKFSQMTANIQIPSAAHLAVIVPADTRQEISECSLDAGVDYTADVANLLGIDSMHLLNWGKVGKQINAFVPDAFTTDDDADQKLQDELVKLMGPLPHQKTSKHEGSSKESASVSEEDADHGPKPKVMRVRPPVMFSEWQPAHLRDRQELNMRASWLLGHKVYGDVLLAYCRMRPNEWGTPVVGRRSFTLRQFWLWASCFMPEHYFIVGRSQPVLSRMPVSFSTPKAWIGQQPQALLNAYTSLCCSRTVPIYQVVRNPTPEDFTPSFLAAENGGPGLTDVASTMVCTVAVHPAGHDSALKVETAVAEDCSPTSVNLAKQQAALSMLHQLQALAIGLLRPAPLNPGFSPQASDLIFPTKVEISQPGSAILQQEVPSDCTPVVAITYSITFDASQAELAGTASADDGQEPSVRVLERGSMARFEVGTGGMIDRASSVVSQLGIKGKASFQQRLPANGPDFFGLDWHLDCHIEVEVISRKFALLQGTSTSCPTVFSPPMSQQRHAYLADLVYKFGATTIVDLGCGEASLFRHMLKQGELRSKLRRLVGIDIAAPAMARGSKRLAALLFPSEDDGDAQAAAGPPTPQPSGPSLVTSPMKSDVHAPGHPAPQEPVTRAWLAAAAAANPDLDPEVHAILQPKTDAAASVNEREDRELPHGMVTCWSSDMLLVAADLGQPPAVDLLVGNVCDPELAAPAGWGPLGGCDLAIIEEVVEHLDPGPLQAFPAAVLGGLRPRAAVVTTPNIQYNAVLKRLSGSVLPTGLRNSDHRFEWTMKEFNSWATAAAAIFGYDVEIDGLGTAADEDTALSIKPALQDVGFATQVAIFTLRDGVTEVPGIAPNAAAMTAGAGTWELGLCQGRETTQATQAFGHDDTALSEAPAAASQLGNLAAPTAGIGTETRLEPMPSGFKRAASGTVQLATLRKPFKMPRQH